MLGFFKKKVWLLALPLLLGAKGIYAQDAGSSVHEAVSVTFLNQLIDTAKKYYPKMKTFDHKISIANSNVSKARNAWFDIFTFAYQYSPNNSTTLVNPSILNGYQLGLFVNMGSLFTKPQGVKQAKEQLAINKLEKEEYIISIETEVKIRYFTYIKQVTILKAMTQGLIDAENAMKQVKYRFEKSEDSFDNYSKSLLTYADRKQSVIEAEGALLIAKSSLEELVCKKLEDIR
jgi:outer membrane protein TolC